MFYKSTQHIMTPVVVEWHLAIRDLQIQFFISD